MAQTYQKINTIYKRYQFSGNDCPNKKWLTMRNKIILGDFSNKEAEYLFDNKWIAESKIDGTNSKIMFFPSDGHIEVGGKSDKADSQHGQFEMLREIGERIKPMLAEEFPKEAAKFVPIKERNEIVLLDIDGNPILQSPSVKDLYGVQLEEVPIYIYGEYYGNGIQKCGPRYSKDNHFVVFDIKYGNWWMPIDKRNELCYRLGLDVVPTVGAMTLREAEEMVRKGFVTKLKGVDDPTLLEEGLVCRTPYNLKDSAGERLIVKIKYCDYVEYDAARSQFTDEEFSEFEKWYDKNKITLCLR